MTEEDIKFLKSRIGQSAVNIRFKDGELVEAKITSVFEIEKDVIFDIVSTTTPDKYTGISEGLIRAVFEDIESVSAI